MRQPLQNVTAKQKNAQPRFIRKVIAITALSLIGSHAYAQKGFDVGLSGMAQTSSLINNNDQAAGAELNYKLQTSFAGGIEAGYTINKHLGVELNLLYSIQGCGYTGTLSGKTDPAVYSSNFVLLTGMPLNSTYNAYIQLNCLKIPILFRYTGNNKKTVFFNSFIGPQINLLTSADIKVNGQDVSLAKDGLTPIQGYKQTTFDVAFGFGAGFNLSKKFVLTADMRFDWGLGDVEDKGAGYTIRYTSYNYYDNNRAATHNATGGFMIGLRYKFANKAKPVIKTVTKTKTTTRTTAPAAKPATKPVTSPQ